MPVVVRESSSYSKVAPRVKQRSAKVSRKTDKMPMRKMGR